MSITYREAVYADLQTLIELRLAYLTEDRGDLSDAETRQIREQLTDYFARSLGNTFHAVVAEQDGEIIAAAFLALSEKPANPAFITGKIGTILNVYTKPPFRKQGIATGVLTLLIDRARQCELSKLELSATPVGKTLYEKLGFREKHSKYTDMQLRLR